MVSIIIPVYNRQNTIKRAIESVLNQTYSNFEIIVVDDCSTDNSVEIVKQIKDERIRIVTSKKNGGACKARNIGIELSKGDILAFQDSDDFWHKDKLEKSLQYLEELDIDFVFSAVLRKDEKNISDEKIVPSYNLNDKKNKLSALLRLNCVSTQTIVARREVFNDIRFDVNLPRFQDWDLALQVVRAGFDVYYIDEILVDCFVMNDSITKDNSKAIKAIKIIEDKYIDCLKADIELENDFYFRTACLMEKSGVSGSSYFMKAYKTKKNNVMLFRYLLAKLKLYKPFCMAIGKYEG